LPNYGIDKFGYRRVKETGKAEIKLEEWAILHRIKRLYFEERRSASEVAEIFEREGVPTPMKSKRGQNSRWWPSTITTLLRDEAYKGMGVAFRYKSNGYNTRNIIKRPREEWIEIPDAYPPLFTPEEWTRLQGLIDENAATGGRRRDGKTPGALRGLVKCEFCKRKLYPKWTSWMRVGGSKTRYLYYSCDVGARRDGGHPGNHNRVRTDALDAWLWDEFTDWLRGKSFVDVRLAAEVRRGLKLPISDRRRPKRSSPRCRSEARIETSTTPRFGPVTSFASLPK
jgi:Recombinase/Recombinase zinc beta ribbon domain